MHILGLPTDIFNVYPATIKFKTYQARWQMPFIFEEDEDRTRQQLTDVIKVVFSIQKDHYYE